MELVKQIVKVLDDKKAQDIKVIKITEVSSLADYLVICVGERDANTAFLMEVTRGQTTCGDTFRESIAFADLNGCTVSTQE